MGKTLDKLSKPLNIGAKVVIIDSSFGDPTLEVGEVVSVYPNLVNVKLTWTSHIYNAETCMYDIPEVQSLLTIRDSEEVILLEHS